MKQSIRISKIRYKVESGEPVCPPADFPALLRTIFQIFSLYLNFDFAVRIKVEWGDLPNCTSESLALLLYHRAACACSYADRLQRCPLWECEQNTKYSSIRLIRAGKENCRDSRSTIFYVKLSRGGTTSRCFLTVFVSREGVSTVSSHFPLPAYFPVKKCSPKNIVLAKSRAGSFAELYLGIPRSILFLRILRESSLRKARGASGAFFSRNRCVIDQLI